MVTFICKYSEIHFYFKLEYLTPDYTQQIQLRRFTRKVCMSKLIIIVDLTSVKTLPFMEPFPPFRRPFQIMLV